MKNTENKLFSIEMKMTKKVNRVNWIKLLTIKKKIKVQQIK